LTSLAQKTFGILDQKQFAAVSGDHNPMHLDENAARRSQAGAPVVHGINLLLWALDVVATARPNLPPLRGLRADFKKFVYLNEPVHTVLSKFGTGAARLRVLVDGDLKSVFDLEFGVGEAVAPDWPSASLETQPFLPEPLSLNLEQISSLSGRVAFRMTTEDAEAHFPAATKWLGAKLIRGLAATSHLVGMVCPGLLSIYNELSIKTCVVSGQREEGIAFRVTRIDPRFGFMKVDQQIAVAGFNGTVTSFVRTPPVQQATMQSLEGLVGRDEFAGSLALIVGGSRGLGELTAKLIATGGGRVLVTWHSGKDDAFRVADEIRSCGGKCETLHYDARASAVEQLASLAENPTHAYYFATPSIFRPQADTYSSRRFNEFLAVYVDGLWRLTQTLRARQAKISIFYPSSIAVTERPPGMTEYAMAKVAGEFLCADINTYLAPTHVTVKRLPRLPTDQTTSLTAVETDSPVNVMLPIVREVQSWVR
jgi:NADP-dependent 3-hydroxy acid dehydrogenase YdfG